MDKKQLLHEIAYYSNLINNHKTHWNPHFNKNVYVKPHFNPNSQFKYVKSTTQTQIDASTFTSVIKPVQNTSSNKVLINPNFKKPNVHINPHFNAANRTILVNPKILTAPSFNLMKPAHPPIIETSPRKRRLSIRSQYKIVKSSCLKDEPKPSSINLNPNPINAFSNITSRKRRSSIRSKYKIVKSSFNQLKTPLVITPRKRTTSIHSKYKIVKSDNKINSLYKIDRRNTSIRVKSQTKKKVLSNGISDILRKNLFKNNLIVKKKLMINQFRSNNTRLTNISGILYKKSHTKLQKLQPTQKLNTKLRKNGHISTPNKILRKSLIKERISNKFSKNKNISVVSSVGNTSRKLKQKERNKLQKNNIPCPVYRRYGQCRRKEAGRCIFLHNPNQIFLCKKFLQGACVDKDCLLSHKVSLEKMPTCKYFLEGCCTKNDCPYLHVKINPKADICRKFLEGFCHKGSECNLRHQFLCPDFERNGKCPKRKCVYPHKMKCDKESVKIKKKIDEDVKPVVVIGPVETLQIDRYYLETKTGAIEKDDEHVSSETDVVNVDKQVNNENNIEFSTSSSEDKSYKRPQLGELPAFIPFN